VKRLAAIALLSAAAIASAQEKAIVAGTVFREPGFALADAKVVLLAGPKKVQETLTNQRGEFVFHVPAKQAKYVVKATMKGYRPEEKETAIQGEERVDVNLALTPEAK